MAALFDDALTKLFNIAASVGIPITLILDKQDGNGVSAPGDGTNGLWANIKAITTTAGSPVWARLSDGAAALIGQAVKAASLPVVVASDDDLHSVLGTTADAKVETDAVGTVSAKLRGLVYLMTSGTAKGIVRGGTKGASTPADVSARQVSVDVEALDVYDNAPTGAQYTHSTARGDGVAVRAGDDTITFTGPALVSSQLVRVRVITTTTAKPLVWEQGRNATLTISGTTITVKALDGTTVTVPGTVTYVEVMWAQQDKAHDPPTNANRNLPVWGPDCKYDDPYTIVDVANQTKSDTPVYYPASTGIDMSGLADLGLDLTMTAGAADSPLSAWIEASDDNTFPDATALTTSPRNVTYNAVIINSATPTGNQYVRVTSGAKGVWMFDLENVLHKYVRLVVLGPAANANNSGAIKCFARRKYQ